MEDGHGPRIQFKTPTFRPEDVDIEAGAHSNPENEHLDRPVPSGSSHLRKRHLPSREPSPQRSSLGQDIYLGSYAHTGTTTPRGSIARTTPAPSPRASTSHVQLGNLLQAVDTDLDTYGVEEHRDGFFDASFHRPLHRRHSDLMRHASATLPTLFQSKNHPLSLRRFVPQQWREARGIFRQLGTSRAGIKLLKTFLGVYISYIVCLVPAARDWLGRYSYIMVLSAIINHAGRPVGSQIDGAALTIVGTVAGLGWGALALYTSTSTAAARNWYGGILAAFLVLFTATIGWLRCVFLRFYQAVLCAGIAICYVCLADTSEVVGWRKVFDYGIPWVLGQAVCLVISVVVCPDVGSRALALAIHDSLTVVQDGLMLPRQNTPPLKRSLAWQFVNLSQAVRDFTIEYTISRFRPDDIRSVRNLIQAVIRSILSIRPDTNLWNISNGMNGGTNQASTTSLNSSRPGLDPENYSTIALIRSVLGDPTRDLIESMSAAVATADQVIMHMGGQGAPAKSLSHALQHLRTAKSGFDNADVRLINHPDLPTTYAKQPAVIEILLFIHPVRQTADKVEAFVGKVAEMQEKKTGWRVRKPSYPWRKAIMRTNPQVRHDRGGLTAGFYFRSKNQLDRMMADLQSTVYVPAKRQEVAGEFASPSPGIEKENYEKHSAAGKAHENSKTTFRYRLWAALHRLQGFESRFAFKVTLVTTLISIPTWLLQSREWWNTNEIWWAVVIVWMMMHPRVGGTFQDLVVRALCAAIGAIWGGLTFAAAGTGRRSPYIMAPFALIYMLPMLHRFTQSSHPRSGVVGCISFTIVSLSAYTSHGQPSITTIAWTRGLAFVVGVIAALLVNWILWPFIARHELRKSLSSMMLHTAILYRGVIAKYVYYSEGQAPGPDAIARSEMLEGRLREGFVRMRQLTELTRHEMRLRAPFNTLPYSALISASESLFEHLVRVRQSSIYFQPSMLTPSAPAAASLIRVRRDAVAVILMNLYALACALRSGAPVPRYLPSAAAARGRLLGRMETVEQEMEGEVGETGGEHKEESGKGRRWADVYRYAYSSALNDIVGEVEELVLFTKEVCGEDEWDSR